MTDFSRLPIEFLSNVLNDRERFSFYVAGVEVTQAIQWYDASQHLTDKADQGPDNGVTLVVNKPAWVRIYVGGLIAHDGVTATLTLQRPDAAGVLVDAYTPTQQGYVSVDYDPTTSYADTRRNLANTLNFVVPADQMHGGFQLVTTIKSASGAIATSKISVIAILRQTLQVRGIPIQYWGPDAAGNQEQIGPTTAAEFAATATWTMLTYPVENVPSISLAGILTWSEPLTGAATVTGGCSTGWNDLLFWLQIAKVLDGSKPDVIYYGLLPAATPNGPVNGCDASGVSAGISGNGITMAHELGHYQGFPHAPCGSVGTPDASYPAYEPYDTTGARIASIGEFGLDVSTGTIYDPAKAKDYMSYCSPPWTSLYHYNSQMGSSWFNPRYVSTGDRPSWWDHYKLYREYSIPRDLPYPGPAEEYLIQERVEVVLQPSIVVSGMLSGGKLDIRSVLRVAAVEGNGATGEERLEILDADGAVIGQGALRHAPIGAHGAGGGCGGGSGGCCCGGDTLTASRAACPRIVQAVVPEVEGAMAMRVVRGDAALWTKEAPRHAPTVHDLRAEVGREGLVLEWHVSGGDSVETHLRLSSDRGKTWSLLEVRARATRTRIPLEVLPPGCHLVQVLVSNGFHTVYSAPAEINVPHRPPTASIHWPLDTATVAANSSLRLWGTGMSAASAALPTAAHSWDIDGHHVGIGCDLWVEPPGSEGEHLATLTVCDVHGKTSITSRFWVSCSGRAPRRIA